MAIIDPTRLLIHKNPLLAEQWHPTKNNHLELENVYANSGRKAWWQCGICEYEWEATIASRNGGSGCPYCAGKIANESNALISLHPEIASQYSTQNAQPVETLTSISHKKVWWSCSDNPDHEWEAMIMNRVRQGDGCPFCSGRYATKDSNLAVKYPELAREFNLERNFPVTPYDLTPSTPKKFWWKCVKDHEWYVSVSNRNRLGKISYCPYCTGTKATHDNNLGFTHPDVAKEYHSTKNIVPVEKIRYGSRTRRWWTCTKGHEWEASVASRTRQGRAAGCPECSPTPRTSKIEVKIRESLEKAQVLTDVQTTYNAFITTDCNKKVAVDVLGNARGKRVVVEYDSWWWHSGRGSKTTYESVVDRDVRKTQALLNSGYVVVRIREQRDDIALPVIPINHDNLIQINWNQKEGISILVEIVRAHLE